MDRPIIFSDPMVQALLAGHKTQTRRLATSPLAQCQPGDLLYVRENWRVSARWDGTKPRELPSVERGMTVMYRAGGSRAKDGSGCYVNDDRWPLPSDWPDWAGKQRVAMHLPRCRTRLTLEVVENRAQQLHDISEEDAIAEGATCRPNANGYRSLSVGWSMDWSRVGQLSRFATGATHAAKAPVIEADISHGSAKMAFASFINELHGGPRWNMKGPSLWDLNPDVTALTFILHRTNIDCLPTRRTP